MRPTALTATILVAAVALLGSYALPNIALDTMMAEAVVAVTDTASIPLFPFVAVAAITLAISSRERGIGRIVLQAGTVSITLLLVALAVTQFNEHTLKPSLALPRPNIVALADSGALLPDITDAESFYAVGDKEDRRAVLSAVLPGLATPSLAQPVRDHWVHETGYSFPSGHSIDGALLATVVVGLALSQSPGWKRRVALILAPTWAICVAYSRVLLDVHRPLDVIAGSIVGAASGLLVLAIAHHVTYRISAER